MIALKANYRLDFFDRAGVVKRVESGRRRALARSGGKMRTIAIRSIRYRKKMKSPPGRPPFSHIKSIKTVGKNGKARYIRQGLKRIYFASQGDSVIVGPEGFRGSNVPRVLEEGGVSITRRPGGRTKTAAIRPRPFMKPALREFVGSKDHDEIWSKSIRF